MLAAWLIDFVVYQVINPGTIAHWSDYWTTAGQQLHTVGHSRLSASIASFLVAVLIALPFARLSREPPGSTVSINPDVQ
jgi:hypothetical protein